MSRGRPTPSNRSPDRRHVKSPDPDGVHRHAIAPNLWFGGNALEAAEHDVSIFPRSRIVHVSHHDEGDPGEAGTVMVVDSELDGQPDAAINGGADVPFTATISLLVDCDGQEEIDHCWAALGAGGEYGHCGWLKDRFGVSWQVCDNAAMTEMMDDPDGGRRRRARQAMFQMSTLHLAAMLEAADAD